MRRAPAIWLALLLAACAPAARPPAGVAPLPPPYDVVITGGRIVDGTGAPWFYGDLAIRGDRIARVTPAGVLRDVPARERLDARSVVVAPGFIDIQGQSGGSFLFGDGRDVSKVTQGITTEILGEGGTPAPANERTVGALTRLPPERQAVVRQFMTPQGFARWLEAMARHGISPNVGSFLGASTVREYAKGMALGEPTAVLAVGAAAACDPFSVEDPSRFTDPALDSALSAVANGVEGQFHLSMDAHITADALLSDIFQHTGTWADYEDADRGRYRYGNSNGNGKPDGVFNTWLRARYAAVDAQKRFARLGLPDTDPKVIQVKTVEAWIDLYLGENWCEAPADSGGPAVSDAQILQQAITKLTAARNLATQAGVSRWIDYNTAGLARANLLAGNYSAAATEAQKVATTFQENAKFSSNSGPQYNSMVQLNTVGFNKAAGMRDHWYSQVDTIASKLKDPWTGQLDSRVEIRHPAKSSTESGLGVDGTTPFYSQWKYKAYGDDIPITHGREMRLIEAEVFWRNGDLNNAIATMNALRTRAGVALSPLPPTTDPNVVRDYLLHERFAEMFLEGHRMADLYRFGVVATTPGLGPGRLMRFPMSQFEAIWNENIEDVSSQRCQPIS